MADRWTVGLIIVAVLCCAAPLLVGAGLASVIWGGVRAHWGWVAAGLGLVLLALVSRRREL